MRAFWGLVALLVAAAALWFVLGRGPSAPNRESPALPAPIAAKPAPDLTPAPEAAAPAPAPASTATVASGSPKTGEPSSFEKPKQTGIAQTHVEASFKQAFPAIAFAPAPQSDGRRRVLGTLGQSRVPALEMVGDDKDLSQISVVGAVTAETGAPIAEHVEFAETMLHSVAPDWSSGKEWLSSSMDSAESAEGNFKADHVLGSLNVHFASWRSLGVYRITVETVAAAAQSAALASAIERPGVEKSGVDKPKPLAEASKTATPSESQAAKPAGDSAPNVETKADGSLVVDGKYTIKGAGTKESPYKLSWDQLVSAQDDYVPRDGRKEIPSRIMMLQGKWIELTGYVAFPLMVDAPDECLSMMNQWDGCCIGVPPTPYDAVEVRLTEPVSGNARLTTYGTVRGRFKVDPHLVGGWLVGLYLMEETTLTPQTYGGFSP